MTIKQRVGLNMFKWDMKRNFCYVPWHLKHRHLWFHPFIVQFRIWCFPNTYKRFWDEGMRNLIRDDYLKQRDQEYLKEREKYEKKI